MAEVWIKKTGDKWAGYANRAQITRPACRGCILKLLLKITAKSAVYDCIKIQNEDGTVEVHKTGAANGRQNQEAT